MEITLCVLVIAVIWIYTTFNTKIKALEQEIDKLKNQQDHNLVTEEMTLPKSEINTPINLPESAIIPEEIEIKPQEAQPKITPAKPDILQEKSSLLMTFMKQNALSIIGIFTLILGIGYFVKYAIDKNWIGESARVAIGIITGLIVMGCGHWLRKNYKIFSSIIIGGGISILYLTITIAFQEYQLFSQNTAFAILTVITITSVILAYLYKSEVLIIVALLGGFFAPLMVSNGQSNYLFLFSYISVLNLGMLVVAYLTKWKSIGWISFCLTTCYLLVWVMDKPSLQIVIFYLLFYVIFYAFALQSYLKKEILSKSDILMLVFNNLFSILGLVFLFKDLGYQSYSIFPIAFAIINGLLAWRELNNPDREINFSVFIAITISLVSIAVALELEPQYTAAIWAIESSLLLYIWKKSGYSIFKKCFNILFPILIIAQIINWSGYYEDTDLSVIFNPIFLTSLIVIGSLLFNIFYIKDFSDDDENSKFDFVKIFAALSYLVIYASIALEIWYHIQEKPQVFITCILLLYSIYFVFIILTIRKKLNISDIFINFLMTILLILFALNSIIPDISYGIKTSELSKNFYGVYLLQWIPFLILIFKIIPNSTFLKEKYAFWLTTAVATLMISYEIYHLYILLSPLYDVNEYQGLITHFCVLYLPIIWAILAAIFIYTGLQKQWPELSKSGFILIGITILKLYLYDIWQMDNVSRIIAFILLGVILLLSSFLFQRLKNIIATIVDKKSSTEEKSDEAG